MPDFSVGNYSDLINSLNPQIAAGPPKVDFSGLERLPQNYYAGQKNQYEQNLRNAFKDGVPTGPDGSPDYGAMAKRLYQLGDVSGANTLANIDIQRQQLSLGQTASANMGAMEGGGKPPLSMPRVAPGANSQIPPSPSNNMPRGQTQDAAVNSNPSSDNSSPLWSGLIPEKQSNTGSESDQKSRPSYVRGKLDAFGKQWDFGSGGGGNESIPFGDFPIGGPTGPWGQAHGAIGINNNVIPDSKLGRDRTGIEIHASTNPDLITRGCIAIAGDQWQEFRQEVMHRVQNGEKLQLHIGADGARITSGSGTVIGQSQGTYPPQTPDRATPPTGIDPEIQSHIARLTQISSNPALPQPVRDTAKSRLEAIQKQSDPTNGQKEYDLARRQGYAGTFQQYQADQAGSVEESKKQVENLGKLADAGIEAKGKIGQLNAVGQLGEKVGYGAVPKIQSLLGQYGIDTKGLSDIQSYERAIDFMAPQLRPVGSGRLMQQELTAFKASLGGLMTTPEGRRISLDNLSLINRYNEKVGEIASDSSKPPSQRYREIYSLPPPKLTTSVPNASGVQGQIAESQFKDGQTATHHKTGQRLIFKNGQWVPFT